MLLVAAAAILGGVVLAALGRAGEMATFAGDTAPIELDEVSATDVALLRPPMSLWGYNAQATEDALRVIARSVTARDVEIATLRRELADLRGRQDGVRATGTAAAGRRSGRPGPTVPASPGDPVSPAGPASTGERGEPGRAACWPAAPRRSARPARRRRASRRPALAARLAAAIRAGRPGRAAGRDR